jgi:hypothetical protein
VISAPVQASQARTERDFSFEPEELRHVIG